MAIDWKAIRDEYVKGQESYRTLAQKHGVSAFTVSTLGGKGGWAKARQEYRQQQPDEEPAVETATGAQEAEQLMRLQEIALDTVALLANVLNDPDQFKRHLVVSRTTGVGSETEERIFEKLDMSALRAYAASMQSMAATVRNLFDLPTKREKQAMDLQSARLQLEAERRMAADAGANETGIAQIAAVLPGEEPDGEAEAMAYADEDGFAGDTGMPDNPDRYDADPSDGTGLRLSEDAGAESGEEERM